MSVETKRLSFQKDLDAKKNQLERNQLGQYATPTALAREMLRYGLSLTDQKVRFFDPAIGTGAFYSALLAEMRNHELEYAEGYEIDPHYFIPSQQLWNKHSLTMHNEDFTKAVPDKQFNLLICNPPYVRHHHMDSSEKLRLKKIVKSTRHLNLSGLTGLYCYFLCLAHEWMEDGGLAGWLIPSEFMDVNYGSEIKRYLLEQVNLIRIHRFDPSDVQFADALVSSVVVWFKKEKPANDGKVEFTFGGTHDNPKKCVEISASELTKEQKWNQVINGKTRSDKTLTIGDIFTIRRGIATGDNNFFMISPETISQYKLKMDYLRPILPSPRFMKQTSIEADDVGNPIMENPYFLIDCKEYEEVIQKRCPELWEYLKTGLGITSERYLCKQRKPWYSQEHRKAPPIICTYMGRGSSTSKPFRFIKNRSNAIVTNSYLMLYPKDGYTYLLEDPIMHTQICEALNQLPIECLLEESRVYGGGLHKLEPKELACVNISTIKVFKKVVTS